MWVLLCGRHASLTSPPYSWPSYVAAAQFWRRYYSRSTKSKCCIFFSLLCWVCFGHCASSLLPCWSFSPSQPMHFDFCTLSRWSSVSCSRSDIWTIFLSCSVCMNISLFAFEQPLLWLRCHNESWGKCNICLFGCPISVWPLFLSVYIWLYLFSDQMGCLFCLRG